LETSLHSTLIKGLSEEVAITLRPSAWKNVGLLVICTLLVAISLWMGRSGQWLGYLCAAFFGLGIAIAMLQFIPGTSYLLIERDGLTVCNLFRKSRTQWTDVEEFFVVKLKSKGITVRTMVGFNYSPSYDRARVGRAVATAVAGCEGALPDTYGQKAQELVEYLNYRLAQSRARSAIGK
jgi:hypothetical protein